MSEKHDRSDESNPTSGEESKPTEPSPFALHSPFAASPIVGQSGSGSPPMSDLFEPSATEPNDVHVELPPDIDAAAQELQADPTDLRKPDYGDSPKTIVSEVAPQWDEPTSNEFPPLIIYGAVPFNRPDQPHTPPVSTVPLAPVEEEPTPIEVEPAPLEAEAIPVEQEPIPIEQEAILVEPAEHRAPADVMDAKEDPASEPIEAWQPAENVEPAPALEPVELSEPAERPAATEPIDVEWSEPTEAVADREEPTEIAPPQELPEESPPQSISETVETLPEPAPIELETPELLESEPQLSSDALDMTIPQTVEPELAVARTGPPDAETLIPAAPIMTTDVEPTTEELASIPQEPTDVIPVAALAAAPVTGGTAFTVLPVGPTTVDHMPTATETFAHAHEEVEKRRGILSLGLLTKLAGIGGFVATVAAFTIVLFACAGLTPFNSQGLLAVQGHVGWAAIGLGSLAVLMIAGSFLWRSWIPSAVLAGISAVVLGVAWFAIGQYHSHEQVSQFNLLSISPYITYVGLGGLALAILGGFIEHRRLREETAVLAAVFTNIIATAGGAVLWILHTGGRLM